MISSTKKVLLILSVLLLSIFFLTSCGKDASTLNTEKVKIGVDGYYFNVDNETETIAVSELFNNYSDQFVSIYSNEDCTEKLSDSITLAEGNNLIYVKLKDKDDNETSFAITIYRTQFFTVDILVNGGTPSVETQTVERGTIISAPAVTRYGYDLTWDYDFTKAISANTTINAVWTAKETTVSFTGAEEESLTISYNANYSLPTPTKTGYTFLGWYLDDSKVENTGVWKEITPKTLEAKWVKNTYTVTYMLYSGCNDEGNITTYSVEDAKFTLLAPTKNDFTFGGWYTSASFTTAVTEIDPSLCKDMTLYAKWNPIPYQMYFEVDGDLVSSYQKEVYYNTNYGTLPKPEKDFYIFDGWMVDTTSYSDNGTYLLREDVTLVAQFTPISADINYYLDGGKNDIGNPTSFSAISGEITLADATKYGYSFDGWYTTSTFDATSKITSVTEEQLGQTLNLYAKFVKKTFTITLSAEGMACDGQTVDVSLVDGYTLPDLSKDYYLFEGWKDGDEIVSLTGTWTKESDATLVASFTPISYSINYILDYGTVGNTWEKTYTVETETFALPTPTSEIAEFVGWYTSADYDAQTKLTSIVKGSNGALTIYGKWQYFVSNVTFDIDATLISETSKSYTYGFSYTLPTPEKVGYSFDGWYDNTTLIAQTGTWNSKVDMTLTPKFTPITYQITYDVKGGQLMESTWEATTYTIESDTIEFEPTITKTGVTLLGWRNTTTGAYSTWIKIPKGSYGDITFVAVWGIDNNGLIFDVDGEHAVVLGYVGASTSVTIPSTFDGKTVTTIGPNAFQGKGLSKVVIPTTVNRICSYAFNKCGGLEVVLSDDTKDVREAWAENTIVEEGNDQLIEVILFIRPKIGWSKWK